MERKEAPRYERPTIEVIGSIGELTQDLMHKPFGPADQYLPADIANSSPIPLPPGHHQ